MRNNFNLKVCFGNSPRMPYEWNKTTNISSIKLERVSSNFLKNVLKTLVICCWCVPCVMFF